MARSGGGFDQLWRLGDAFHRDAGVPRLEFQTSLVFCLWQFDGSRAGSKLNRA
jgi:hypothetical protein